MESYEAEQRCHVADQATAPTISELRAALDRTYAQLDGVLQRMGEVLDAGPDAGGWTPRQVLSHVIGSLWRVPVHAGFYLSPAEPSKVPIQRDDSYWMPEWETAPLDSFALGLRSAYQGNIAMLQALDPSVLDHTGETDFGALTLGQLLQRSYTRHLLGIHVPQLEAFLEN
jgi:DinB superfamily